MHGWSMSKTRCLGKRHYFADEEPEPESPSFDMGYDVTKVRPCARCGSYDHRTGEHYNKTISRPREDDYTGVAR